MMNRIKELDVAKGIAIILVVIGHVCMRKMPEGNEWYTHMRTIMIFSFHMPLFMFLSGITSFKSFERINNASSYFTFVKNKFVYFGRHFLFLAALIFTGKLILQNIVHVDNEIKGLSDFFVIFYNPLGSFSVFLWFIYTLLIFYAITPLLLKIFKKSIWPILIMAVAMYFINAPQIFTLSRVFSLFIFYFAGYIVGKHYTFFMNYVKKYGLLLVALFVVSIVIFDIYKINMVKFISLPAILYISYLIRNFDFISTLGKSSYYIYLYNTICIGLVKAVLFLIIPWDGPVFIFYFFVLTIAGLVGPLYLQKITPFSQKRFLPAK